MNPQTYQAHRDSLIGLIAEVCAIGVAEPHATELASIRRKCQEDQFEVVLVGVFSGGKSTTFNTLCDGREISPRGSGGVKTSAGNVSVQHIADEAVVERAADGRPLTEWAEVLWREEREILAGMAELVVEHLERDPEFHAQQSDGAGGQGLCSGSGPEDLVRCVSLSNEAHLAALRRALGAEWDRWESNKSAYGGDRLDLLSIASLHLRFWGTQELEELRKRKVFSISEIQGRIVFPEDWFQRWARGRKGVEDFTSESAAFAFIGRVFIRLRSNNLARLGCRITDCPGLFVSESDTRLAKDAMSRADAIWFLIGGDRTLGQEERRILEFIRDCGWSQKLKLTVNLKGAPHQQMLEKVVPATNAVVAGMGFGETRVRPYDALLAFRACQGALLLRDGGKAVAAGALGERDFRILAEESKAPVGELDPMKAWRKLVNRRLAQAEVELVRELGDADPSLESIGEVRRVSRLDAVLEDVETMVVERRARSILLTNGSHAAQRALERLEGDLKSLERSIEQKVDDFEKDVRALEKSLERFLKQSKRAIAPLREESVDLLVFDHFWREVVISAVQDAVEQASPRIHDEVLTLKNMGLWMVPFSGVTTESLAKDAGKLLGESFKLFMGRASEAWVQSLRDGNVTVFQEKVALKAKTICSDIRSLWQEQIPSGLFTEKHLLEGISMPALEGLLGEDLAELAHGVSAVSIEFEDVSGPLKAGGVVIGSGGLIVALLAVLFNPALWVLILAGVFGSLLALLLKNTTGLTKQVGVDKLRDKIWQEVKRKLEERRAEGGADILNIMKMCVSPYREAYRDYLDRSVDEMKRVFEERCGEARASFDKSNEEREQIALHARTLRTQQIEPVHARLREFSKRVALEC
jgi:hypothetical protein